MARCKIIIEDPEPTNSHGDEDASAVALTGAMLTTKCQDGGDEGKVNGATNSSPTTDQNKMQHKHNDGKSGWS